MLFRSTGIPLDGQARLATRRTVTGAGPSCRVCATLAASVAGSRFVSAVYRPSSIITFYSFLAWRERDLLQSFLAPSPYIFLSRTRFRQCIECDENKNTHFIHLDPGLTADNRYRGNHKVAPYILWTVKRQPATRSPMISFPSNNVPLRVFRHRRERTVSRLAGPPLLTHVPTHPYPVCCGTFVLGERDLLQSFLALIIFCFYLGHASVSLRT